MQVDCSQAELWAGFDTILCLEGLGMRVFVGYGYNERDKWIEDRLFPILRCAGFAGRNGKGMEGKELHNEVKRRLEQSDAAIGFFTTREGQGEADFTSHIWVRDEMIYAISKQIIPVREWGAKLPDGLLRNGLAPFFETNG
jgi:hypothetical protein